MRKVKSILGVLLVSLAVPVAAQNKFGVMTHLTAPTYDLDAAGRYMENASRMAGEWGWVRQYVTADPGEFDGDVTYLLLARAHHLKPVLYINDLAEDWLIRSSDGSLKPRPDADGGYEGVAASVAEWVRNVEGTGVQIPWLELWNEPNLGYGWAQEPNPREYARFHMAVARAVRAVSPDTIILNAALSPSSGSEDNGDGRQGEVGDRNLDSFYFLHEMMNEEPGLVDAIDIWSSHPYPLNHPPTYNASRYTASGYQWELRELDRYDFHPKVLITETGYRLDDQPNADFPVVTNETRVGWLVWAYFDVWLPDDDLVGICPFLLGDPLWKETGQWNAYSYIDDHMNPRPILDAVASLPREAGSDYMPRGEAAIEGMIINDEGEPVRRAMVFLMPGGYADMTDEEGRYAIDDVPAGIYTVKARASEHISRGEAVTIGKERLLRNLNLDRCGLLANGGFEKGFRLHQGPDDVAAGKGSVEIEASAGTADSAAVAIRGKGGIFDDTDYLSVDPGRDYTVSVRFRLKETDRAGVRTVRLTGQLMRSHTPNEDEAMVSASVTVDSGEWRDLQIVVSPRHHMTQRLRAIVEVDAPGGTIILDDLRVERVAADFPKKNESE